jgi:S1-C subfamily serine protease
LGKEVGPLTEQELLKLRQAADIADDTPVRRGDSTQWQPLASLKMWGRRLAPEELFDQNFKAVPLLDGRNVSGSGFIISTQRKQGVRWFIVTNKHVVEGLVEPDEPLKMLPFRPQNWGVFVFLRKDARTSSRIPNDCLLVSHVHRSADVALIECTEAVRVLKEMGVSPVRLARKDFELAPGTEVVAIGHPLGEVITYTRGQIAGPEREDDGIRYHQLQVPLAHGNSGGPVLDMSGQVVGIVTKGKVLGNQGQLNYALHLKYLYDLLDQIP